MNTWKDTSKLVPDSLQEKTHTDIIIASKKYCILGPSIEFHYNTRNYYWNLTWANQSFSGAFPAAENKTKKGWEVEETTEERRSL